MREEEHMQGASEISKSSMFISPSQGIADISYNLTGTRYKYDDITIITATSISPPPPLSIYDSSGKWNKEEERQSICLLHPSRSMQTSVATYVQP